MDSIPPSGPIAADDAPAAPRRASRKRRHAPPAGDSVAVIGDTASAPALDGGAVHDDLRQRIGHLTRTLHDALRELGYDRELAATRENLPDARDRLAYIARVTGEAAEKVLNAVDHARSVQEELTRQAERLRSRWQAVAAYAHGGAQRATPAGRELIEETCAFFSGVTSQAERTQAILTDIMLAQDFHDLTGQVIRKVVALAHEMEAQLVKLLLDTTPPAQRPAEPTALEGPVVNGAGRTDVVRNQADVDDLLASLGF
ncbi:MAG: protein phosphatase CheZ [Rhodocyclaceae bacterium]|nr:protein phosphatase CheZ [Rhodocyclaceae bacterium]